MLTPTDTTVPLKKVPAHAFFFHAGRMFKKAPNDPAAKQLAVIPLQLWEPEPSDVFTQSPRTSRERKQRRFHIPGINFISRYEREQHTLRRDAVELLDATIKVQLATAA